MIQNFAVTGGPAYGRRNLPKLHAQLTALQLDGFLVPHEDEYNNEYLPDCNERLMWVSGFTGSAGFAVVLTAKAVLFVDGRYILQGETQVDHALFERARLEDGGIGKWLSANLSGGDKIGYDPRLHTPAALAKLNAAAKKAGAELVAVSKNPIDQAWEDRPTAPSAKLTVQPLANAGMQHAEKRAMLAKKIAENDAEAAILTAPASIAWTLNVRGGDVMCTPVPLASMIMHQDGRAELFIAPEKLTPEVKTHFGNEVSVAPESAFTAGLAALAGRKVMVDPGQSSSYVFDTLKSANVKIIKAMDIAALPKACKNAAEIAGTVAAHIRDGAVITNFLHWLATEAQSGEYDEIMAAEKLESLRQETGALKDLSFETISGFGPNGALPHYRVNTASNLALTPGSLYLVDSGGQYIDGTTDITRTVPIGTPSAEMIRTFTLVLKGHIALSRVRFPKGTTGHALDSLARMALWEYGFDYDHGTGHGVGVYLGVHEGPQRIAKSPSTVALAPGMIVSNEPGYYREGAFGIRIENLQYVTEAAAIAGGERKMHGFETLTLAPISLELIDIDLLSGDERSWLDAYHARVRKEISPLVSEPVRSWLHEATQPCGV